MPGETREWVFVWLCVSVWSRLNIKPDQPASRKCSGGKCWCGHRCDPGNHGSKSKRALKVGQQRTRSSNPATGESHLHLCVCVWGNWETRGSQASYWVDRESRTSYYGVIHIGLYICILKYFILMGFHPEQPKRGRGWGHWYSLCLPECCIFSLCQSVWLLMDNRYRWIVCMCASWEFMISLATARSEDMGLQQVHLYQPTGFSSTARTFCGDVYNFLDLEKCF